MMIMNRISVTFLSPSTLSAFPKFSTMNMHYLDHKKKSLKNLPSVHLSLFPVSNAAGAAQLLDMPPKTLLLLQSTHCLFMFLLPLLNTSLERKSQQEADIPSSWIS